MALNPGARLGPYEITSAIGAGGMGEVYRATDSNLKRAVAIKVLPASVSGDADRLARFQREAQVLAALNHPNIAAIYGIEKTADITGLVMELVEGQDLSAVIGAAPAGPHSPLKRVGLALSDALPIARQLADALEAAHEQGIIHRDLKPANIKIKADGTVKVLDFGLAKALAPAAGAGAAAEAMEAPTLTSPAMTQAGMILGTAAYMSPEQARGRAVDRRADIWAFGVVLYEMLAGSRPFEGDGVSITIANVLKEDVRWDRLPADLPAALQRLLHRCLDKDPKRRLRDIGEARVQIEDLMRGAGDASSMSAGAERVASSASRGRVHTHIAWATLVVAVGWLAPMAVKWWVGAGPEPAVSRFELELPARTLELGWPEISPDGRRMAVIAEGDDRIRRIWIRSLDDVAFHAVAGTEGASYPFWSPNSQSVGFFADDTLKKIATSGGPPQTLCAAIRARGGTWSRAGVVLFSASIDSVEQLNQVAETGGPAVTLKPRGLPKATLRRFPHFLPDGRHFLFFQSLRQPDTDGVYLTSIDDETSVRLPGGFTEARYSNGFLLFVRDATLLAQPFDLTSRTLRSGDPVAVAASVADGANESSKAFSVSDEGTLISVPVPAVAKSQLQWFDRNGRLSSSLGPAASQSDPRISPDERRVVTSSESRALLTPGIIWLTDAKSGLPQRLTFNDDANYLDPVWSTDLAIVFAKTTASVGMFNLFRQPATGGAPEQSLLADRTQKAPQDVSRDGRYLVYIAIPTQSTSDLMVLTLDDRKQSVYARNASHARISPNGRWLAYAGANSAGRPDVYVQSFPTPGSKFQISTDGGDLPVWSRAGDELFYQAGRKLFAVPVAEVAGTLQPGRAVPLFDLPLRASTSLNVKYDVSRDGRFLFDVSLEQELPRAVVMLNWKAGLKK